jgi:hypothetical protein
LTSVSTNKATGKKKPRLWNYKKKKKELTVKKKLCKRSYERTNKAQQLSKRHSITVKG